MVLLRGSGRRNCFEFLPICRVARRRPSELEPLAVRSNARWTARERQTANGLLSQPRSGEMKLAESWVEHLPTATALEGFHDEVEEHDEVDEAKDGCGGVDWQQYVLKKPHTSNKKLHELAREIRGVEKTH